MAPHSPGADQIDTLQWVGFVVAAVLVIAVNAALIYAARRRSRAVGARPGRRSQLRVGGALALLAAVVFIVSIVFTEKARETPETGSAGLAAAREKPLEIKATGQQWLWRYDYPNGAFSYYKLVVPVDTAVSLELHSTDVVHSWNVPALAGKREAVPGKQATVVFRADREGTYSGDAATFSGQGYASMRTAVEVVSPAAYEEFVKRQKTEIEAAQERIVSLIEAGRTP